MAEELLKSESEELDELLEDESQKDKFMTFQTGKEFFGISISYVNEIITMQPIAAIPEVDDYIKGLINLRGKIIPVIDVRIRFKMEPKEYTDRTSIIVINVKTTTIGLIVEELTGVDIIADDNIVPPPTLGQKSSEHSKYVYGIARTGNVMKLLLDPEKLIRQNELETVADDVRKNEQS